jgi:hypothetical protein
MELPYPPRWLKPKSILLEGESQKSTIVVTIRDRQLADKVLQGGLYFGGNRHITKRYWESGKGEICPRCCKFGHFEGCTDAVKCYLCGGPHLAKDHLCPVEGCRKRSTYRHLPRKCANCSGNHYATSVKCPKKWEDIGLAREKPSYLRKSPLERSQPPQDALETPRQTTLGTPRHTTPENLGSLFPPPSGMVDIDMESIPSPLMPFTPTPVGPTSQENAW